MQRFARHLAVVTALSTLTAATVAGAGEIRVQC
jgi:predicted small secreted protein